LRRMVLITDKISIAFLFIICLRRSNAIDGLVILMRDIPQHSKSMMGALVFGSLTENYKEGIQVVLGRGREFCKCELNRLDEFVLLL
jgi:hypothetical protein